jgi:hypothetical protein
MFSEEGIFVWAIPPLLPHSSDHFLYNNPTHLPPLFKIPFPDDFVCFDICDWNTISSWYFGSRESIYFDIVYSDSKLDRFELIVKPDLSDASLHVINSSEFTPYDFDDTTFQNSYRICEDTLVSVWNSESGSKCGVYTGLTSAHFPDDTDARFAYSSCSLCPASGRFVYCICNWYTDHDSSIVVVDLT